MPGPGLHFQANQSSLVQSTSRIGLEAIQYGLRLAPRGNHTVYVVRPSVQCPKYVLAIVTHFSHRFLHETSDHALPDGRATAYLASWSVEGNGSVFELLAI